MSENLTTAPDSTLDEHNETKIDNFVSEDEVMSGDPSLGTQPSQKDISQDKPVEMGESGAEASKFGGANIDDLDEDEDEDEDEDDDSEEYSTKRDTDRLSESQFKPKGKPLKPTSGPGANLKKPAAGAKSSPPPLPKKE